jgi:hypothetical protein
LKIEPTDQIDDYTITIKGRAGNNLITYEECNMTMKINVLEINSKQIVKLKTMVYESNSIFPGKQVIDLG